MKITKTFLSVIFLLTTILSFAQNTLSGQIRSELTEQVLSGASIYLPDLKIGTVSDENGNFKINNLRSGNYLIEVKSPGYKSIVTQIDLSANLVMDFRLDESITELDNVVITGVSRSTELKRNPVIIKTLDQSTLNRSNSTNLIDALQSVPGISQIGTGPNISKPIIRGLGHNRVITLNNGLKQEGQQWGDEHGIEIDQYSVSRVEIIKGPGSLMYGSDGIAGVLNFLPPKLPLENEIQTQLLTNYQSNNNLIGTSIVNSGNRNGFQWSVRLSNKIAGNYENKYDGKVYNSGFKETNGSLTLGINRNWGHSFLNVSSYNSKLGIVEGERDELGNFVYTNKEGEEVSAIGSSLNGYKIGTPYQKIHHFSVASNNYFLLNKGSVNVDLGFQNNLRKEYEEAESPNEESLSLSLNTLNYNIRYNYPRVKGWEISSGISGMLQTNKNKGVEFLIPDYDLFDIGAFVFAQKTFNQLTVAGGFRFDNRHLKAHELFLNENEEVTNASHPNAELKFPHFNQNYNGFSGSLGLSYQSSKNSTLKLNLSQGFRAPNIAELGSNGKHEGAFRYEIGNPNLKSEISRQIDLAYYLDLEHIGLELSPFINFIEHYIFLEKINDGDESLVDSHDNVSKFQYKSGNATLVGGEIYIDIHPHPWDWLHIENSFSYVKATQKEQADSMRHLPFTPAPHYKGSVKAEFNELSPLISKLYLQMSVDHYFKQNKVYSAFDTESPTSAYTLLSASIGVSFSLFNKKEFINLFLSGNNLGNIAYQNHLSRLKYADKNPLTGRKGVFDMGRNIGLKMILNL